MKRILVVGHERKLRALLRAQLREEGFNALGFEALQDAESQAAGAAALLFDTADAPSGDWQATLQRLATQLPVVIVAGAQENVNVPGICLLRRPATLGDVVTAIRELASPAP